jgi:hypothetical protein
MGVPKDGTEKTASGANQEPRLKDPERRPSREIRLGRGFDGIFLASWQKSDKVS